MHFFLRHRIYTCAISLVCLLLIFFTAYFNNYSKDQLERQIGSELPIGSSRDEVQKWLHSKGIKYAYIVNSKGLYIGITTTISGTRLPISLRSVRFEIHFYFDDDDKLKYFSVSEYSLSL